MKKEIIKPFDLAKAKAGAKLRTKGGYPVEIFKWVARGNYPIRGIIIEEKDDMSACWKLDGSWIYDLTSNDLVIVEEVEEPKFMVKDWITDGKCVCKIVKVTDCCYYFKTCKGLCWFKAINDIDESYHLWTVQDLKSGDVLVASDGSIFILASVVDCACKHYVALTTDGVIDINEGLKHYWETSNVHPATKEERDTLFVAIKEAGYEWDAEKLELKKIKPEFWSDNKSNSFEGFFIGAYGDIIEVSKLPNTVSNYNIFATKKQVKSALAMARISQIMANDIKNFGGVVTDEEWKNNEWKYVIYRDFCSINTTFVIHNYYFLAFHTSKQRNLFLEKYPQLVHDFLMIPDEETK
jgi:hypothetical protein